MINFYNQFEGFYQYGHELYKFATYLDEGYYIQNSIDSIILKDCGHQLPCEAVYMYGIVFMLSDRYIPGSVKYQFIIAVFSYCEESVKLTNIDVVCKVCKDTNHIYTCNNNINNPPLSIRPSSLLNFPFPKSSSITSLVISSWIIYIYSPFPFLNLIISPLDY